MCTSFEFYFFCCKSLHLFVTMTTSTVSSIVFTTASGRPVEVSSVQMEMARNRLWRSDVPPTVNQAKTAGPSQATKESPTANKENDYNFFDDNFDDDFDLFMETYIPVCAFLSTKLVQK